MRPILGEPADGPSRPPKVHEVTGGLEDNLTHKIAMIGLGGTIAMTGQAEGLVPSRNLESLLPKALTDLTGVFYEFTNFLTIASANLTFGQVRHLATIVDAAGDQGCTGAVVVQGTDTIEETAFALELLVRSHIPIAVTGAMRGASHASPDGAANLTGAVQAVLQAPSNPGVMVVLNDDVHAARHVRKAHTTALDAFSSGEAGLLGHLHEGRLKWHGRDLAHLRGQFATADAAPPPVALIKIAFDADSLLLDRLQELGYRGCIIEAMGAGHVPETLVPLLERLARQMPVVLCSRAAEGAVCEETYGYSGSETDLLKRGLLSGGACASLKARVLLSLCLSCERPKEVFRRICQQI